MKFTVKFVNDAKLVRVGEIQDQSIRNPLRYELSAKVGLAQHLTNIHKLLGTSGITIQDPANNFMLRVKPLTENIEHAELPMYLNPFQLTSQLSRLSDIGKSFKKKGYAIDFVLSREILAQRIIDQLNALKDNPNPGKEILFNLRSMLYEVRFTEEFCGKKGLELLFQILPNINGYTTLGYAISAIVVILKTYKLSIKGLLSHEKLSVLFNLLEIAKIPVSSPVVETLELCVANGGWQIVHSIASSNENKFYQMIFHILEYEDLHSRSIVMRFINCLLQHAENKEATQALLNVFEFTSVLLSIQKSLWITLPEVESEIKRFQKLSGIVVTGTEISTPEPVHLEHRVKQLQSEIESLHNSRGSLTSSRNSTESDFDLSDFPEITPENVSSALQNQLKEKIEEPMPPPVPELSLESLELTVSHAKEEQQLLEQKINVLSASIKKQLENQCTCKETKKSVTGKKNLRDSVVVHALCLEVKGNTLRSELPTDDSVNSSESSQQLSLLQTAVEQLKLEKQSIQEFIEDSTSRFQSIRDDKHSADSECSKINSKLTALENQKLTLQQSVRNLEKQRRILLDESDNLYEQIETTKSLIAKAKHDIDHPAEPVDPEYSALEARVRQMELFLTSLAQQKQQCLSEIAQFSSC